MKHIQIDKVTGNMPESLGELNAVQLLAIGDVFMNQLNKVQSRVYLASVWCIKPYKYNQNILNTLNNLLKYSRKKNLPFSHIRKLEEMLFDAQSNVHYMSLLTDWFDKEHVTDRWIISELNLKRFFINRKVQGPAFRFGNVQFWEWCKAETFFTRACKNNSRADFNLFLATIYHPVKKGKRIPFDDKYELELAKHAKYFNQLSESCVAAIKINYIAFKKWLAQKHPHVFKNREGDDVEGQTDYAELLLRTAKSQHIDEDIIKKKALLVEMKKLEITAKDHADAIANQNQES